MKLSHISLTPSARDINNRTTRRHGTTVCHNMRPSAGKLHNGLVPAGTPRLVSDTSMRPFYRFRRDEAATKFLISSGTTLGVIDTGVPLPMPAIVGELESPPLSAVALDGGLMIMTETGRELLSSGSGESIALSGTMPRFPDMRLGIVSETTLRATIPESILKGTYNTRSTSLSKYDAEALTADMAAAYRDLESKATAEGLSLQPVLARYRFLTESGDTLYVSPLKMICVADGFQVTSEVSIRSLDSLASREKTTVEATAFTLGFRAPAPVSGGWYDCVAAMEIEVSPVIHPIDFTGTAPSAVDFSSGGAASIRCYMPGVSAGMAPSLKRVVATVREVVARADTMMTVVARVNRPFSGSLGAEGTVHPVSPAAASTVNLSTRFSHTATDDRTATVLLSRCRAPHQMLSRTVSQEAGLTLYADPEVELFDGYPLEAFALTVQPGKWRAAVTVSLDDGTSRLVSESEGSDSAPGLISPLLVYPDSSAVTMTVTFMSASGGVSRRVFPLTAVPSAGIACYLSPSLKPVTLDPYDGTFIIPARVKKRLEYKGYIVAAGGDTPLTPRSALRVSEGRSVRLVSALRPGVSWNYSYGRFYSFSHDGIYVITADTGGRLVNSHPIDCRGTVSPDAVTTVPGADAQIAAIAGGDLIIITSGRVRTVAEGISGSALVWSQRYGELSIVGGDTGATVVDREMSRWYTRSLPAVTAVYSDGCEGLLSTAAGLLTVNSETGGTVTDCRWEAVVDLRDTVHVPRVRAVDVTLIASGVEGTIELRGDNGGRSPLLMSNMSVSGSPVRSLSWRVIAPARRVVTVSVSGSLTADALLRDAVLTVG